MTDRMKEVVLAIADANMNVSEAGRMLYLHRNTILYYCDEIVKRTGLDPRCFYDLEKLVWRVKKEVKYG